MLLNCVTVRTETALTHIWSPLRESRWFRHCEGSASACISFVFCHCVRIKDIYLASEIFMAAHLDSFNVFVDCSAQEAVSLDCYACFITLFCGRSNFTTSALVSGQLTCVASVNRCVSFADFQHSVVSFAWHGANPGKNIDSAEMPHYHNSSTVLTSAEQMFDPKSRWGAANCTDWHTKVTEPTPQPAPLLASKGVLCPCCRGDKHTRGQRGMASAMAPSRGSNAS